MGLTCHLVYVGKRNNDGVRLGVSFTPRHVHAVAGLEFKGRGHAKFFIATPITTLLTTTRPAIAKPFALQPVKNKTKQ